MSNEEESAYAWKARVLRENEEARAALSASRSESETREAKVNVPLPAFLPNDLAEWIRSEATQLSITPSEVVVGALTNYRDSIEWYFGSRGRTRPVMANERHQFSTSDNAECAGEARAALSPFPPTPEQENEC